MVVVSCAVTRTVNALEPTDRAMAPLAEPLVTAVPCTVTVALLSAVVGVSLAWVWSLATVPV